MNVVIKSMQEKIDGPENRNRQAKLIIYGFSEVEGETPWTLERALNKRTIEDTLELKPVAVKRIHWYSSSKQKLLDSRDKSSILKWGYEHRDTGLLSERTLRDEYVKFEGNFGTVRRQTEKITKRFP